jgi:hypothetical protein
MGRYYTGDIEGKFWFGVQSSDDASNFDGIEEEVYWEEEDGSLADEPYGIKYTFLPEHCDQLELVLSSCVRSMKGNHEKLDSFFASAIGYTDRELADHLEVSVGELKHLLEHYARHRLALQIKECVEANGKCEFTADYY